MPNLRDIKRRINSVQNTKQITRTMEMVATAKIRHATERITAATPYSEAMQKTLAGIAAHSLSVEHPLLEQRETKKAAIAIVVVSDRGLAGGFNSNIFREVDRYRAANDAANVKTDVIVCGKKGVSYFHYRKVEPVMVYRDMSADPTLTEAREISSYVRSRFLDGSADEVKIFYNHARNAADQDVREEVILPISAEELSGESKKAEKETVDTDAVILEGDEEEETEGKKPTLVSDFEPSDDEVLNLLLPAYVGTMIYHALIDSAAAEQGARRKAMKSATDNATDMVETLGRLYNRVRQGAITTEITEIVGGAAALEDE
ncbi:MAG: ATP synthase F1 subunit gamma [Coriobacteriales bacterium]|jgi:F-type H+-transporting ATPase subunit gamma